jgi:hypothetical protein
MDVRAMAGGGASGELGAGLSAFGSILDGRRRSTMPSTTRRGCSATAPGA